MIRRRSEFDLEKARERAHILEGLLAALGQLDAVIAAIRASESADAAKTALMAEPFELSDRQAQAVLDMQLRRLAALERQRIESEHAELVEQIAYLEDLLASPEKIDALIQEDCAELKEKYGDARRTQVFAPQVEDISDEDLVPPPGGRRHDLRPRLHEARAARDVPPAGPRRPRRDRRPDARGRRRQPPRGSATRTTRCCSSRSAAASTRSRATRSRRRRGKRAASRWST